MSRVNKLMNICLAQPPPIFLPSFRLLFVYNYFYGASHRTSLLSTETSDIWRSFNQRKVIFVCNLSTQFEGFLLNDLSSPFCTRVSNFARHNRSTILIILIITKFNNNNNNNNNDDDDDSNNNNNNNNNNNSNNNNNNNNSNTNNKNKLRINYEWIANVEALQVRNEFASSMWRFHRHLKVFFESIFRLNVLIAS